MTRRNRKELGLIYFELINVIDLETKQKSPSMAIEFPCIRCGVALRVPNGDAGNRARCPSCQAIVDIPPKDQPMLPFVMAREKSDVIDYEFFGKESQYVEITLDPAEVVFANMSRLMYMSPGIAVEDAADPDDSNRESGGVLRSLVSRMRGGRAYQMTAFCNVAERREVVAFAPASSSRLIPFHMDEYDRRLICREASILCLARGIEMADAQLSVNDAKMAELRGDGIAILSFESALHHRELEEDQSMDIATSRLVALSGSVQLERYDYSGVERPVHVTTVRGPGEIWLHTGVEAS